MLQFAFAEQNDFLKYTTLHSIDHRAYVRAIETKLFHHKFTSFGTVKWYDGQ